MGMNFFHLLGNPWTILQPAFWLVVGMLLLTIFMTDWLYGVIPDSVNLIFFSWVMIYRVALVSTGNMQRDDFVATCITTVGLGLFFWFLVWVTKEKGMGWGDVKLSPTLGLMLGWPKGLLGVLLAFMIGAIVAIFLLVSKKKKMGQTLPFGPFLVVGALIALVWGNQILAWYWQFLI